MSGTSMDGVDLSLVKTDGQKIKRYKKNFFLNYKQSTKDALKQITSETNFNKTALNYFDKIITDEYIRALQASNFVNLCDVIGFHGQTLLHIPKKISIQVGNPKIIAKKFKKKIVYNFRQNDILNNGQGAPLSPIHHKSIIEDLSMPLPACFINIGGISNLTYWDGINLFGFDTGPGNCLLDEIVKKYTNEEFDHNGELSLTGKVNFKEVKKFLDDIFFKLSLPKSLDKLYFKKYLSDIDANILNLNDKLATLSEITVISIVNSINSLPNKIKSFCITGGGYKNKYLLNKLKDLINSKFYDLNSYEISPDFIESEMIAYLSIRRLNQLPSTFPSTTGVLRATICGDVYTV